ncbi:hypothetical protein ZOD2009_14021 [Haladaptatus paucihalophilus DX253]|uniref:Uncharacterized protein n=1 Tax=Haladaptatus paucihalophilus DX253 TaxID=797209 RepID=E7QVG8_HALPU|nr:hypothetical protein ZOD2009_14021 [Haladaptatus paucihalophilus DX253]
MNVPSVSMGRLSNGTRRRLVLETSDANRTE